MPLPVGHGIFSEEFRENLVNSAKLNLVDTLTRLYTVNFFFYIAATAQSRLQKAKSEIFGLKRTCIQGGGNISIIWTIVSKVLNILLYFDEA